MEPTRTNTIEKEYAELVAKSERQLPGINDLLTLYRQLQTGIQQSQTYLQLFRQHFISSTSNTTR